MLKHSHVVSAFVIEEKFKEMHLLALTVLHIKTPMYYIYIIYIYIIISPRISTLCGHSEYVDATNRTTNVAVCVCATHFNLTWQSQDKIIKIS